MNNAHLILNVEDFESMLAFGFAALKEKEEEVNRLNVFPVPDGDTGGNMCKTYESGLNTLKNTKAHSVGEAAALFARGALLGARGNSGVILSQIFKGIAVGLDGKETAGSADLCAAFAQGVEKSYKAVVKPVEGTILTVFREATESVAGSGEITLDLLFEKFKSALEKSLKETPEKLSVLKKAGVIDSGGAGLNYIFGGFLKFLRGEKIDEPVSSEYVGEAAAARDDGEEEFGYCTEFLLNLSDTAKENFDLNQLISRLESIGGESIVALRDNDIVKVHVHVLTPGDVLNIAQQYGEFMTVKIENMTLQHSELKTTPVKERVGVALVAVAGNDGFSDLFYSMGADCVVSGGQSMNPSVEDFITAFDSVNADDIIVLPDNSNVILTANQARGMYKNSRVHVLETKSLSQGYSALSLYNPDSPVEEIKSDLNAAKDSVISMELTRAIRNADIDGLKIEKDDYIVIEDGKMTGVGKDYPSAFSYAIERTDVSDKSIITVFVGEDADASTEAITGYINKNYPDIEVSIVETKQKIYAYIIAIE